MGKRKQTIKFSPDKVATQIRLGVSAAVHLDRRRLFLTGEVTEEKAAQFMVVFSAFDATEGEIYVTLNSEGGSVDHGFAIYDTIRLSNNPVIIEVVGSAQSIAMLILQAGDLRRASPEARLMIHQGKLYTSDAAFAAEDLKEHGRELAQNNDRYYRALAEKSHLDLTEVLTLCKKDTYFSSEEAAKHGLIDEVIRPTKRVVVVRKKTEAKANRPAPKKGGKKK